MKKIVRVSLFTILIAGMSIVSTNESVAQVGEPGGIGGVVCKCKKVFLGNKCASNGTDGNQCNGTDNCSDYDGNCH